MLTHSSSASLTGSFLEFSNSNIKAELSKVRDKTPVTSQRLFAGQGMMSFMSATCKEVLGILKSAGKKSCELNPLPTWLLGECSEDLLPTITSIVNAYLETSTVPHHLKCAIIRPLLKRSTIN